MLTPAVGCWRQFTRVASNLCLPCVPIVLLFPCSVRLLCMWLGVGGCGKRGVRVCSIAAMVWLLCQLF